MAGTFPVVLSKQRAWRPRDVLVFDARNGGDHMANVRVVFVAAARKATVRIGLFPGWPTRVAVPLSCAGGQTLFLPRTPGRFQAMVEGGNIGFDDLLRIEIAGPVSGPTGVSVKDVRIADAMPSTYTFPEAPLVDALHQWRARGWPGKAGSLDAVRDELQAELNAPPPTPLADRSAFGGWTGLRFDATGWFRRQHDGRRWWLVDPEGCAFWSVGANVMRPSAAVNPEGVERMFDPPLPSPRAAPHLWSRSGERVAFDALRHNLERALGRDWLARWYTLTARRFAEAGFNTVGNWSDPDLPRRARLPYVFTLDGFPTTDRRIFRDFPDVYAAEYAQRAERFAGQLEAGRRDARQVGYFMANEPQWAFLTDFNLGRQLLLDDQPSATREALVAFVADRYGEVAALNRAWGTNLPAFDALRRRVDLRGRPGADADTAAFTRQAVDRYVRVPAEACRRVDPHHLNLGLRWAWIHSDYQLAGADAVDVFSINHYHLRPDAAALDDLSQRTGRPVFIGEFHIGSLDRGLPSGGIRNVRTLAESADAYRYYIEQAAAVRGLVGAHYFQWTDQHLLGRFDGENMQIGLNDITYRMYPEHRAMCRKAHAELYRVATGEAAPYDRAPDDVADGTLTG